MIKSLARRLKIVQRPPPGKMTPQSVNFVVLVEQMYSIEQDRQDIRILVRHSGGPAPSRT